MIVNIYHKSINNNKNPEKPEILKNFSLGVKAAGDRCGDIQDYTYRESDVGMIQGWITDQPGNSRHLILRNSVINEQIKRKKYVVSADSNLFLYATPTNKPHHYLRYSFNGVFPNLGNYCDKEIDPKRWQQISRDLNLPLKDYRKTGTHILLCLQRNGGWSMGDYDVQEWAKAVIKRLRSHTDRPIVIRSHPGDKMAQVYLNPNSSSFKLKGIPNLIFSDFKKTLKDDLKNSWAVVNHNSSPAVGAAIEGYPIFVTDPEKSQCSEIANLDFSKIENPNLPDRQSWAERISMFHWKFEELRSGECWRHMRKQVV